MNNVRVERFFTTCIENSNRLEYFADHYLLAPLHYLLTQKSGPDRIEHYKIEEARVEWLLNPEGVPDHRFVRLLKTVAAIVGALLLTLPGAFLKWIAQTQQSSQVLHRVLNEHRSSQEAKALQLRQINAKVLNDAQGLVLCCVAKHVSLKSIAALSSVCKAWRNSLSNQKLSLWRTVVLRFPQYQKYKQMKESMSLQVPLTVDYIHGWIRADLKSVQEAFAPCKGFVAAFGGLEQISLLPLVETTSNRGLPLLTPEVPIDQLPVGIFRTVHVVPFSRVRNSIGLRIVRTLQTPADLPHNPKQMLPPIPEEMPAGNEMITIRLELVQFLDQHPPAWDPAGRVDGNLWPAVTWLEPPQRKVKSWITGAGLRWLQDLLRGKTCGPFPGTDFGGEPTPQVTYQLWNPNKWDPSGRPLNS